VAGVLQAELASRGIPAVSLRVAIPEPGVEVGEDVVDRLEADAQRTRPGVTPENACSSSVSWLCVVLAGWITRLRTSPMLATWLCSSSASTKRLPASLPALDLEGEHRAVALAAP
jgi:hypothetical protein